ncbi:ATP-binding protein [Hyperthermus butylicus]|uniref:ATPase n=1 Tax=Hyperthermus butylicus (strain DSM 5456 / JCM 9403 / PLM1-5) TaxID=415426 RepID=A2BKD1_HYPBU|nr:ATP-binding protein [Hyperthermus butylicus]ABM80442.1 putative ATPase [Hyperthermus butylicus DSM 5456]
MALPLARMGEEVGIVLSGASVAFAPIALRRDRELEVREEDLVVIYDHRLEDYYMLGVVRWITRYEPFLRRSIHNIYIEHPDALSIETVMPFTNAYVEIYGAICLNGKLCSSGQGFQSNIYAPTPGSRVFRLTNAEPLTEFLTVSSPVFVGRHKYSGWRLPLDTAWINYHVGVFGATGTGKSRLVAKLIQELISAGYKLIIFDHSGVDYVPLAKKLGIPVISASSVRIEPQILASIVTRMMGSLQSTQRDAVEVAAMCYAASAYGYNSSGQGRGAAIASECQQLTTGSVYRQKRLTQPSSQAGSNASGFDEFLGILGVVGQAFNLKTPTLAKLRLLARFSLPPELFDSLKTRGYEPRDIVEKALSSGAVVLDASDERDIEVKRGILASIASAVWEIISERREPINLGLVVDEAQNYACEHCGASSYALETIAREGRKWRFFIIVASQRITRDIKTSIRSNLGTVFFSKLQATGDLQELAGYLDLGKVTEASLAMLGRREFYVAGLMNPLRRPMLLRVDEVQI